MGLTPTAGPIWTRRRRQRRVDAEGELFSAPAFLGYVWLVLVVLTILEAADELFGIVGPVWIYAVWVHDLILAACALLVLGRAAFEPTTRRAWLAFGMALAVWCIGSIAWSVVYGARAVAPYPTFADIFWLLWYPLMTVGIYHLIRVRVPQFELHRWMDGIAATLVVLVVGFALVVQPAADHTTQSLLATLVNFTYPVLDVLLMGAILGVYGLLGWRPDTMWLLVGLSVLTMSVADAASAVQEAHSVVNDNHYAFAWTVGALLIALAAWVRTPGAANNAERVTGMRAIALALFAQALAIGIQIYAVFRDVGKSERIVTVVVLVVASVQIILTRPRATGADRPRAYQRSVAEPTAGQQDASP
jgi:hypothetical protein